MFKEFGSYVGTLLLASLLLGSLALTPLSYAANTNNPALTQLLDKYQRQEQRIEKIIANSSSVSKIEQEAIAYRLLERHLHAFDTINQISLQLIELKSRGLADPQLAAEVEQIMLLNNQNLIKGLEKQQRHFNQALAEQDAYSIKGFRLYLEHLSNTDLLYSALVQQVLNQQALGFNSELTKQYLIDHLYTRAESFSGMVGLLGKQDQELDRLIKISPDDQDLQAQLAVVAEQLSITGNSFKSTVDQLGQLGFDASFYQQTLLKLGGQITTDVLNVNVLSSVTQRWFERLLDYGVEHGGEWVFKLLLLVLIYYVFRFLSRLMRKLLAKSLDSSKLNLSALMKEMIISSLVRIVQIIGLLFALAQVGISLAPILTGLGVAGFIIGFALQDTLGNFAAGMMILLYRPYDVGDMVEVGGGVFGKVKSMNLVSTTILTIDNQTLVIPNSKIWGDVIKNITAQKLRRVDLIFGIGYADDIEKAESVLMDLLEQHPLVLSEPEPVVKLHTLNESSVDFVVRPWVKTDDYWDVYWDITRAVKFRFDQDGISIPFPQRDVHFYPTSTEVTTLE